MNAFKMLIITSAVHQIYWVSVDYLVSGEVPLRTLVQRRHGPGTPQFPERDHVLIP